jgi:LAO/AO transport system kinase
LLAALYPKTGRARIIGVTGSPGAGKSTLVAAMARHYRATEKRVGIIAVDPTSPFTGGAILGDRIRMADLYTDRQVFIRSMATRGFLGGLAKATNDAVDILDAAGFDVVLVETVGVGQDEVEVVRTVQTNIVVLVPGMGDDIQAIKAGIMEIGDIFVVNKADRPGADKTVTEVTMMMSLVEEHGEWIPPIVKTVASKSEGIAELDEAIVRHYQYLSASGELDYRNRERVRIRIETQLKERFMQRLIGGTIAVSEYHDLLEDVLRKRNNPHDAAESVLRRVTF